MADANGNAGLRSSNRELIEKQAANGHHPALVPPIAAPSPLHAADLQLEAVAEAGKHPERTAQLAADLGLGHGDVMQPAHSELVESVIGEIGRAVEAEESRADDSDDDEDDSEGCEPLQRVDLPER